VSSDFIRDIIRADLESGRTQGIVTRFPPEPNGHLHIGHAMAICLNHAIAEEFGGVFHLRFDDTNPVTEDAEFVDGIQETIRWLGCDWGDNLFFASDYFEQLYAWALELIDGGKAFVCDLTPDEIRAHAGSLTEPGRESPYRDRLPAENRDLFERMRSGEFEPESCVLRAKIDMHSPVLTMRDPILYRIQKAPHHRTGTTWCIYPMYDFAHCLSDALESITHSLCSMEFVDHRPVYDWLVEQVSVSSRPRQYEFSRLNVTHTVTSKRKLRRLVEEGFVTGWDDPRMPTLVAQRRRGVRPESIGNFVRAAGVTKRDKVVELARYEHHVREDLNVHAPRVMGVLDPLKLVIENYPEEKNEDFALPVKPQDESAGTRLVPFGRELYIERGDFQEDPPKKFFRLAPGREVRLRGAYLVTCSEVVKDEAGQIIEIRCRFDPESRGGDAPDGRKVKGTIHWVSLRQALAAEVRLYDTLFTEEHPEDVPDGQDFTSVLNPESLVVREGCFVESSLAGASPGDCFQFERLGYFCVDTDSRAGALVFNRTVTLRDSWAKLASKK
jgi:glutaminyl-tRNA synthetase